MALKLLLKIIAGYNPNADMDLVERAYKFAKEAHLGQMRESGEDFFEHVESVAFILTDLHMDSSTIAAGLLHDVLEDTKASYTRLKDEFGEEIALLVKGVTKIKSINFDMKQEDARAETLRKVLLATAKDVRVILVKLADRLHNMRTLKFLKPEKRRIIAGETLFIYAPIAHKLGINMIKTELEDYSLRFLEPEWHEKIKKYVRDKKEIRQKQLAKLQSLVSQKLIGSNLKVKIYSRAKTFYSIYRKIKIRGNSFEDIYDLLAMRVITSSTEDCYKVLGIIHSNWKYMPSKFADYIANPKPNGYQSIHTKILYEGRPAEIQIRSEEMHREAEEGLAAHWRYKGTERDKKFDKKLVWLKQILEWKATAPTASEFVENLKVDLFKDEIIVFTPMGEPISLPEEATAVDFAYEIHTSIGNKCSKCKINGKLVSLDSALSSGDLVEIITSNKASPSRQWLRFVKTSLAKSKIRVALGIPHDEPGKNEFVESKDFSNQVKVKGISKPNIKQSKCCPLKFGDSIMGFRTKDGKISIHMSDCTNVEIMEQHRRVDVEWKGQAKKPTVKCNIIAKDRIGLAADVLNEISRMHLNVISINTKSRKNKVIMSVDIEIDNEEDSNQILERLPYIKSITDVHII